MRHKSNYFALVQHSRFLRASLNLAYDRSRQLNQTLQELALSSLPTDSDGLMSIQQQTAREIGGINTKMLLDAPQEIEKYHFGPLQIALSLFSVMVTKYKNVSRVHPTFQDDVLDTYCQDCRGFLAELKDVRNSILHNRYDNIDTQRQFVRAFTGGNNEHLVTMLTKGVEAFDDYLRRLWHLLQDGSGK